MDSGLADNGSDGEPCCGGGLIAPGVHDVDEIDSGAGVDWTGGAATGGVTALVG
jgi:hypothetical protein